MWQKHAIFFFPFHHTHMLLASVLDSVKPLILYGSTSVYSQATEDKLFVRRHSDKSRPESSSAGSCQWATFSMKGDIFMTHSRTRWSCDAAGGVVYVSFMDRTNISTAQSFGYKFDHFMSCVLQARIYEYGFFSESKAQVDILIWWLWWCCPPISVR